jgi:hypothetical protein
MTTDPKYRLTLRALPGKVPVANRLRRLLKTLLRAYGFRCERVEDMAEIPQFRNSGIRPETAEDKARRAS